MSVTGPPKSPKLPPRWFVRAAWSVHRGLYRILPGRRALWRQRGKRWGTMRLTTIGRRTGQPRAVIVGYVEDGDDLVTLAMNGWANPEPAWWLNLQENPDATVELVGGSGRIHAYAATGEERERLWAEWRKYEPKLDDYAALRDTETAVVVLQRRAT
ncbi:MAG: nitroreductase/quinone reductase family protein [Thermocrispum agreste]|uniref:Nitroreductase family deazaflavin-dependent oxidoreductase n=1 Tax=Thermocrispum agreste TaxID=37925 RepID=A0A2W4JN43_9PSEU|nr:MAG: nitroreductase family deazaflavin-dependent oxidoreductase [Thermocrispum agreste]